MEILMRGFYGFFLIIILVGLITGCSGGGSPVAPDEITTGAIERQPAKAPYLLGLFDIAFDVRNQIVEVAENRTTQDLWNIVALLQPPFTANKIGVEFLDFSTFPTTGRVDVRLTINHPLYQPEFRIFDVRGVFMGDWSITDSYNSNIKYPGPDEYRILNSGGDNSVEAINKFSYSYIALFVEQHGSASFGL
jgi:hypothetical protein